MHALRIRTAVSRHSGESAGAVARARTYRVTPIDGVPLYRAVIRPSPFRMQSESSLRRTLHRVRAAIRSGARGHDGHFRGGSYVQQDTGPSDEEHWFAVSMNDHPGGID